MKQRVFALVIIFSIATVSSSFAQAPAGGAQRGQGGQRQGGGTFTTNGNGGIVDSPALQGQRGQRGPATPAKPAPRDANGRALLTQPQDSRDCGSEVSPT